MNKLLQFVITHGNLNLVALSDLLSMLDAQMAERFVTAAFGIEDYHFPEDCPKVIKYKEDKVLTFKSYDYLKDEITATYPKKDVRYYPNAEKAKGGSYDFSYSKNEGYEYESVRDTFGTKHLTLAEWIRYANTTENN